MFMFILYCKNIFVSCIYQDDLEKYMSLMLQQLSYKSVVYIIKDFMTCFVYFIKYFMTCTVLLYTISIKSILAKQISIVIDWDWQSR